MPGGAGEDPAAQREKRRLDLLSRVYTLDDLLDQESTASQPLLGNLLREQEVTILGGHGGHGKSEAAIRMCHAYSSGGEFLGHQGEGGTTVILDVEMNVSAAQRRVMNAFYPGKWERGRPVREIMAEVTRLNGGADIIYAVWPEGIDITKEGPDLDAVAEVIDKARPKLVCLDPAYKMLMGNPNELEVVMSFIHQIDALRHQFGFAFLLPMHPRKPPSQGGGRISEHDLFGSAAWSWWAERVLTLYRPPGPGGAILRFEKDRESELPYKEEWVLSFDSVRGFERLPGDATDAGEKRALRDRIWIDYLQAYSPRMFTRGELAELTHAPEASVRKATDDLRTRHEHGQYPGLEVDKNGPNNMLAFGYRPGGKMLDMAGARESRDPDDEF